MLDNFVEIVKLGKVEDETQVSRMTQSNQDKFEMHVRAANIVRAAESLTKLISDIKQYLILNDFPSLNDAITENSRVGRAKQQEIDKKLTELKDEMARDLYELEDDYYSGLYK